MSIFQWEPKKLVMLYSPLAHCLNVADTKTCPCMLLLAHGSADITQLFNSSCNVSWSRRESSPWKEISALFPGNLSMGKSTSSAGGQFYLTASFFCFCFCFPPPPQLLKPSWAVIGMVKLGVVLVWSSLIHCYEETTVVTITWLLSGKKHWRCFWCHTPCIHII